MYIEVILPVPLADTYTYFVPPAMEAQIVLGVLVSVPFGKKNHIGIVYSVHNSPDKGIDDIKAILDVESEVAIVRQEQFAYWKWIADYYLCKLGEVYKAVIPAGYRSGKTPKRKRNTKEKETATQNPLNELNALQNKALKQIQDSFASKEVCLLHGVTSSGKTEIYTHLIQKTINKGKQVLYLLPEIALTTQITNRLKQFFGSQIEVYHSKISNNERIHIWNDLLSDGDCKIILGVRSSIFLPFKNLGLIIVDEEHEPSYKQQDPAPRYHGRNAAIMLARMHQAKTILGSATPSVESYHNAVTEKYAYVSLNKRFEDTELPHIIPVNTFELRRKKKMKSILSPLLIEKIQERIDRDEQVLLFQNRRGFAQAVVCKMCDWTPRCRFCDISLTFHKGKKDWLSCHYCGRVYQPPKQCPDCGHDDLKPIGFGTEKVEEEVSQLFPGVSIGRMDADTTKTKRSLDELIDRIETADAQIIIGTQMISKGLDFGKLSLVGILNADSLMNFPDFRAYERAYQLMTQVAGRGGRRKEQGEVVLQTAHPEHPLIEQVINQNYEGMYQVQTMERELFRYPPFSRIIHINLKHKKEDLLNELANDYALALRERLGDRIIGPDKPAVGRIQNLYLKRIIIKMETTASLSALRVILNDIQAGILSRPEYRYAIVQYDVDPV